MRPAHYPQTPSDIWNHFYQISQIPRPSKKEKMIRDHIKKLAQDKGYFFQEDTAGNILLKVPGRGQLKTAKVLAIQNHLDMVCDKDPSIKHDFEQDPLKLRIEGDWLMATGTTLGADNGIGVAAALALATTEGLEHPPLELLFTVDEETGLGGALNLSESMISARKMLNLDTEEWGAFYVGCAGGRDWELHGEFSYEKSSQFDLSVELSVSSLTGGHSGIDIHRQRANAIVLLAQLLEQAQLEKLPFGLMEFHGGRAHNIIPREAKAHLLIKRSDLIQWEKLLDIMLAQFQSYLPHEDRELEFSLIEVEGMGQGNFCLKSSEQKRLLGLLLNLPHGAHTYVRESVETLVSMSSNLAIIHLTGDGKFYGNTSLRFFVAEEILVLERKLAALCLGFGIKAERVSGYPNWRPNFDYSLLNQAQALYHKKYGHHAKVLAVHAGLECGIIKDKLGEIEILSFGPTIEGAHSPTEKLHIPSVTSFWDFLIDLVKFV